MSSQKNRQLSSRYLIRGGLVLKNESATPCLLALRSVLSCLFKFSGQPMYGQLIDLLDKRKVLDFSRTIGSERYVKSFDAWQYLLVMLYAVIKSLDSLREISASMYPEANKLAHIGLTSLPRRSTLSDANARRSEKGFERVYRNL